MANYYVDLTLASGGSGTSGDPWGWSDFLTNYSSSISGDIFNIKGYKANSGNVTFTKNGVTLQSWEGFGPWRLSLTGALNELNVGVQVVGPIIKNAILYAPVVSFGTNGNPSANNWQLTAINSLF